MRSVKKCWEKSRSTTSRPATTRLARRRRPSYDGVVRAGDSTPLKAPANFSSGTGGTLHVASPHSPWGA